MSDRVAQKPSLATRRRIARFVYIVLGVTAGAHAVFAMAAGHAASWLGLPHPKLLGVVTAISLLTLFPRRLLQLFSDRPRSWLWLHGLEEPYFAHWCAALGSAPIVAVFALARGLVALARGTPFEVPGAFAFGCYAIMLLLSIWGVFIRRRWVRVREVQISIPKLGPDLDGYRIVQLSDLHIGGLTPPRWLERWVRTTNRIGPDLVVVTGDLITHGDEFRATVAEQIGKLRAADGVCVTMGNHDYFGDAETFITELRHHGARVLRNEAILIARGRAHLHVVGVDDVWTGRADVSRALRARKTEGPTILLAHDPALFRPALRQGVDLVLSGHTHGGQVAVPFLARSLNLSKLAHQHHLGLYREGESILYVHPGLGTTGPPVRIGSAPEITVFTLRPAPAKASAAISKARRTDEKTINLTETERPVPADPDAGDLLGAAAANASPRPNDR